MCDKLTPKLAKAYSVTNEKVSVLQGCLISNVVKTIEMFSHII